MLGGIGQILLTDSYRHAPASTVAPFAYTTMIWAVAIGYFAFGEVPQPVVLLGAVIVIAAGPVRHLARAAARPRPHARARSRDAAGRAGDLKRFRTP